MSGCRGARDSRQPYSEQERERLIDAFTKTAAERGYESTTIGAVTEAAGLPRAAFYRHFRDKGQCLTSAYDRFFDRLIEESQDAIDLDDPYPLQVKAAVGAALQFVVDGASFARLFTVEAVSVGPTIMNRYFTAIQRVVVLLRAGREHSPEAADLPELTERVLVSGVASFVIAALLEQEEARLAEFESQLVEILLLPYLGSTEAQKVAV